MVALVFVVTIVGSLITLELYNIEETIKEHNKILKDFKEEK